MFLTKEIISKKRYNQTLLKEEIDFFIDGVISNDVTNEQISALAMAICLNGLTDQEAANLTLAMRDSGHVIKFDDLPTELIIDKHSTGGVSDLVSIPLAPLLAACGCYVPMIAGRGLGHTGGTVDKLESIPGYKVNLENIAFKKVVQKIGCAIIGQTDRLAPADRRIYAVRDTTGTVRSVELIASSILSKKSAAGIQKLVMDVKVGNGAFMSDLKSAQKLASTITNIGKNLNMQIRTIITDMNQALGSNIGNSLEIIESIQYLTNYKSCSKRLHTVIIELGIHMLQMTKLEQDPIKAKEKLEHMLESGKAAEIFDMMVYELSGIKNIVQNHNNILPKANIITPIFHEKAGYVKQIDTCALGSSLAHFGGARRKVSDILDYSIGFEKIVMIGEYVDAKNPIVLMHCNSESLIPVLTKKLNAAIQVVEDKTEIEEMPVIYQTT